VFFFSHICDVEILANFTPKVAKLVEITPHQRDFFQNLDFVLKKSKKSLPIFFKNNIYIYIYIVCIIMIKWIYLNSDWEINNGFPVEL
jgi:hypothetical protein